MTGKTTPLYIVCSPCRCVGTTLISRLLTEFYVVKDRPVAAFDLADEGPQLIDYLPKFATIAEIGDIHGQMALFDRLIAESGTPRVIDVGHRSFKKFFTILRDIGFFDEARRHSIETLILFIVNPSAASSEAYAMLRRQFTQIYFITVRNQIKVNTIARRVVSPSATTLPSSLDIPALGFSLRALIDRESFSFSRFWQVTPAGLPDAVDNQLRGWLEYIFLQFRRLEFSIRCEDPSALATTEVSRLSHATHRQLPVEVAPQGLADDVIDQCGGIIVAMLQKAAELSNDECTRSRTIANELSHQLRVIQDRLNQLETEVEYFRHRAFHAETWLQRIQREIEQILIVPTATRLDSTT
jgi:hypothetical protein